MFDAKSKLCSCLICHDMGGSFSAQLELLIDLRKPCFEGIKLLTLFQQGSALPGERTEKYNFSSCFVEKNTSIKTL